MYLTVEIEEALLNLMCEDLQRPHSFAFERVGFMSASVTSTEDKVQIKGLQYLPVLDTEYLYTLQVGALIGPDAIRRALQWGLQNDISLFYVHIHDHYGIPIFSDVDRYGNSFLIPDFFKVCPALPHGALIFSKNNACGEVWLSRDEHPIPVHEFTFSNAER